MAIILYACGQLTAIHPGSEHWRLVAIYTVIVVASVPLFTKLEVSVEENFGRAGGFLNKFYTIDF